jgi:Zn-dependent protease with chaperone function
MAEAPAALPALWFDGRQSRGQPVRLWIEGGTLWLQPADASAEQPPRGFEARAVVWPERTRHGQRVAHLPGGGSLAFDDAAAFDRWLRGQGRGESWIVWAQQRWRATAVAVLALVALATGGVVWGVPWAATLIVAAVPAPVEASLGDTALEQLRQGLLTPTRTPPEAQQRWRERLTQALEATYATDERVPWTLHFAGGGRLGANALALPGGHIVITDELLALLQGADDAVLGVLAHEHGHVRRRHGLHALVRFGIVSAASSVALGDFSAVVATLPALLAHLGYSRDAEREADADAARVLLASGRDPAAMALLFERLATRSSDGARERELPIAFASHPADEERVRFFREYRGHPR